MTSPFDAEQERRIRELADAQIDSRSVAVGATLILVEGRVLQLAESLDPKVEGTAGQMNAGFHAMDDAFREVNAKLDEVLRRLPSQE